jgi:transposase
MDRDFESKKHGYSAQSYLEVLEDQLPKFWVPGLVFMHDSASIHAANTIPLLDWPPYSPDLNPIENGWFCLKKQNHGNAP